MELLATVVEVGAYSERQYQKQDGSSEYFKSRGIAHTLSASIRSRTAALNTSRAVVSC